MKLHPATLEFLKAINDHNTRKYFASVKDLYDDIRENMKNICKLCIQEAAKIDSDYAHLEPKDCLFRIYRDARRLKDGDQLYKNNFGFVINVGGKKARGLPSYYFHIQPGGHSFFCGGVYLPPAKELKNLRDYLSKHGAEYHKLTNTAAYKKLFGKPVIDKTTRLPRGTKPYTHHLDLVLGKNHMVYSHLNDKELLSIDIEKYIAERIKALNPRMSFLMKGVTTPIVDNK